MPDDSDLGESSVEGFSSGYIKNVSDTKDIVVSGVLKGLWVDIEEAGGVSEACLGEESVGGGGHQGVEVVVGPLNQRPAAVVPENSQILILS